MANVWSLDTVKRVQALYVKQEATKHFLSLPEALTRLAMEGACTFKEEALSLGVDIHPGDVRFKTLSDLPWGGLYISYWAPPTTTVEVIGGVNDGARFQVRNIYDELHIAIPDPLTWADLRGEPTDLEKLVRRKVDVYALSGWKEIDRCWAFSLVRQER